MIRYTNINTGIDILDQSLENYLMHGLEPGGFLTAILSNDLFRAVDCADTWNRDRITRIAEEIQAVMPWNSYGDRQRVDEWLANKDGRQSEYAKRLREQKIIEKLQIVT
jgi:hypothetical protein